MRLKFMAALPALLAVPAVLAQAPFMQAPLVQAPADPSAFTVGDIKIEGLQRISEGTVFNYLPVNIGDRIDARRAEEALRSLYATGFFRDVELRRDGGTLVIVVLERPSIESFTIEGNKDIKTEDLEKSLRNVGLARGKTFNESTLDEVKRFLTDQYYSRGKYGVKVETNVTELPDNRVRIAVDIVEGKRSKIRQINVVGNEAFSDEELADQFKLRTPNLLSWYRQDDRYSREELSGDLEKLRSYYLDRGYANFDVESTQVTIAPDREDMFITMNVKEGEVYRISDVKIAGDLVVPEEELRGLVQVRRGDIYSQRMLTATTELMALRLGADGYAFAKIDPVPQEDEATKEIAITFLVDPGNRAYVRRINFNNTSSINDDVLRREMRQMEGGYLSNAAVDRSKLRLQRLPYIEDVKVETTPVPGSADLVDVNFEIKEGLPGQFSGGIGYSESQSVLLNGSFVHSNFMGTGNRVAAEINAGQYAQVYSLSHTDPYTTIDGVSRTVQAVYRSATQFTSASSDFSTDTGTISVDYGWPISEFQSVRAGLAISRSDLLTDPNGSPQEAVDWVRNNGDTYTKNARFGVPPLSYEYYGTQFDTYSLTLGWGYDSRNRALFADRGSRHRFNMSYTLPGSGVEFYTLNYDYMQFVPLTKWFTLLFSADVGYGLDIGDTTSIPPYRRFYAGGPESVRGFQESRLGPKDSFGNPYGGNLRTVMQTELLLPMPDKFRNSARFSIFFDAGNTFSTDSTTYVGRDGITPVDYEFSFDKIRYSTGLAVQWLAPLGVFRFSYAVPLNAADAEGVEYGDETEGFQFSIGQAF
jgi:outer membrane protein insertion porin family